MLTIANRQRKRAATVVAGTACGLALALLLAACASAPPPPAETPTPAAGPAAGTPAAAAAAGAAAPASGMEILGIELREGAPGAVVEVTTRGALVWTTYRDGEEKLVIELPDSRPAPGVGGVEASAGLVAAVAREVEQSGERPLSRLVINTRGPSEHSVVAEGGQLRVEMISAGDEWVAADEAELAEADLEVAELAPAAEPAWPPAAAEEPAAESAVQPAGPEEAVAEPAGQPAWEAAAAGQEVEGVPATRVQNVEVEADLLDTTVRILGDGDFYYSTFTLQSPDRFVVDLIGVVNTAPLSSIPVDSDLVERVRVAQFKPRPELVSRVVVDLRRPAEAAVERLPDGLVLRFAAAEVTTLADDVAAGLAPEPEPAMAAVEPEEAPWAPEPPAEGMGAAENATVGTYDLPEVKAAIAEPVPPAAGGSPLYEPEPLLQPSPEPMNGPDYPEDLAAAASELTAAAGYPAPQTGVSVFDSQTVGGGAKTYQGEPMTMSLKDADIKDVLRSFAQISGLNVVVQPGVSGTVTVELTNVPWDQALEQILKINSLDYQLEGNIMRIAPVTQLRAEAEEQQRLRQAQALSIPLRTVIKRVSYADARQVASLLQSGGGASLMSQRGSVVVDPRTNTLIIKELPTFMDTVIAVIENLDTPEPQVMIEARIIETTKRFSRSLGIQWAFAGVADAAHGNTTDLEFPNNGTIDGGVSLLTGGSNGFLDIMLGNVLNTFTLDATLQAAENEGLINILSAPRITTLNNERASIQSGLQIPIQTVANNTVSVQFVNATLRLDVTPHVTAEGTVLMDINIQKREPQLAFAVVGATNAPIATRDARTRVIVRDGGTAVIGGIYEVSSDQGEDRVPGLSNIPVIKHLFKNRRRNDENEELLIFITPRVVKL